MQLPSSITTRLQYQHKSLLELIDGLSDEEIRRPLNPGKWSIFEQIVHLETYQHLFVNRIRMMLDHDNPTFERYTAEADPLFHDHLTLSSREVIQDLMSTRKELANGILSFNETDLSKTGVHPVYGAFNLVSWVNFFLLHEAHHLFEIFKMGAIQMKQK